MQEAHNDRNYAIEQILIKIAEEIGIPRDNETFRFNFIDAVKSRGRIYTGTGYVDITEDDILEVVDERFYGIEHAGRGASQLAIYSTVERKEHELKELRSWLQWVRQSREDILQPGESTSVVGQRFQEWVNGFDPDTRERNPDISDDELLRRQNLAIEKYDEFHLAGLKAEGKEHEFKATPKLVNPILSKNFDITIAAQGIPTKVMLGYVELLQRKQDLARLHRTLKLIAATIFNEPEILMQRGPMDQSRIQQTLSRLSEFDLAESANIVRQAGRESDYGPIRDELSQSSGPSSEPKETHQIDPTTPTFTDIRVSPTTSISRTQLEKRKADLERLQNQFKNNQLPEILNFGDKHGQADDLDRSFNSNASITGRYYANFYSS